MSARHGLLAGGNWIVDHVKLIDTWPAQDALANILAESIGNGGAPYNVLKDLARLGAPFPLEAVGLLGDDADGGAILADCAAHRIDTAQLRPVAGARTSHTDVMTVRGTGRRTFFHGRGANALLAPEHFGFARSRAKMFHLGYLVLLDTLDGPGADGLPRAAEVLRGARAHGLITSVDCVSEASDRLRAVVAPVLPEVDLLFANDFEAEKITGLPLRAGGAVRGPAVVAAANRLLAEGVRGWCVLHFPEGVYARSAAGEEFFQPSVRVSAPEIAGAVGAGDALAAGILFGLHEGWPMMRTLEAGVCAAAACLRHASCSEGIDALEACLARGRITGFVGAVM
ncbi:MAG: PfkB family carbohydrate kinase [Opitutaceae bacterium]